MHQKILLKIADYKIQNNDRRTLILFSNILILSNNLPNYIYIYIQILNVYINI